jgi:dephospho-CoA kinase
MIIGLTGGIATGKSELAAYLNELGWEIVDADSLASQLSDDPQIQQKLKKAFGSEVILSSGHLNRRYLSRLIFFQAGMRRKLNQIFFPAIRQKLEEMIKGREGKVLVLVAPLLHEAGLDSLVNLVVWVEAPLNF